MAETKVDDFLIEFLFLKNILFLSVYSISTIFISVLKKKMVMMAAYYLNILEKVRI